MKFGNVVLYVLAPSPFAPSSPSARSFCLREKVLADYVEENDRAMKKVAFGAGSCMAWYQVSDSS